MSELEPIYGNDRSYFVLGNYDREPIRRLNLVVDRLNRRTDAYAFRMVATRQIAFSFGLRYGLRSANRRGDTYRSHDRSRRDHVPVPDRKGERYRETPILPALATAIWTVSDVRAEQAREESSRIACGDSEDTVPSDATSEVAQRPATNVAPCVPTPTSSPPRRSRRRWSHRQTARPQSPHAVVSVRWG